MKIIHFESGNIFEITDHQVNFRLFDSGANRSYLFKESYEAIWHAIELIRNLSYDLMTPAHFNDIAKHAHVPAEAINPSVIAALKKENIVRTYYDQLFLKLLSSYRQGTDSMTLSNRTNFIIDHEVASLLRTSTGSSFTIPSGWS